jgi:predicted nucleic acid-binding protein
LDEKRGRKVASALGLKITGTAGLLMEAAATDLIDFDDALQRLSQVGFRLGSHVSATLRQNLAKRTGR